MSNEEFQRLVLEKLDSLESSQKTLQDKVESMDEKLESMDEKLDSVVEQTADLTEFKYEVRSELDHIKTTMSRIEIATADNWGDIARLKSVR